MLQISIGRKTWTITLKGVLAKLRSVLRPAQGDHRIRVYNDHDGTTATCTCVDQYGDAWFVWDESSVLVAQQVHLHLIPDELIHP